jgi:hypothetical protein
VTDDNRATRLVAYEVWEWCELIRKMAALEELDIDYVIVRNREADNGTKRGWDLRVASGTQQTIDDADVTYAHKPEAAG